jgi:small-conductance mechanosensitive channel
MKKLAAPLAFCLVTFLVYVTLYFSDRHLIDENGLAYFLAIFFASLSVLGVRIAGLVLFDIIYLKRTKREAPDLLRMLFSLALYSILFTMISSLILKLDLSGILATSAVVSVVIGLALQDTLGNFFAGTSLHIEQPFQIRDSIRVRDKVGKVEAISWRTTTIRTNNNTTVFFPNSLIAREPIEVFHFNQLHRHLVEFSAPYSISPQTVIQTAISTVHGFPAVSSEVQPTARITSFADSSIQYELFYWVTDFSRVPDINARLRERLWYAFNRENIDMPFPIRHILWERQKSVEQVKCLEVDYKRVINQISIFEPLSKSEREAIVAANGKAVYAPGESMVRYGNPGDSMFVIGRGKAEVRVPVNGNYKSVAVLETGSFFGEMSLFSGDPRSADVVALEEVEVLEIKKASVHKLLLENEKLAEAFSLKVSE